MGAINYCTSDYITLGAPDYSAADLERDPGFMDWAREEIDENPDTARMLIYDAIRGFYDLDEKNARAILNKYSFYYFHVAIKPGYYEGFTIDIANNFPLFFDFWQEKREAQKEVTRLRRCLEELAGVGLVQCFPGWCTKYGDYNSTLQGIRKAVREMREEVRTTPTWEQYAQACGEA